MLALISITLVVASGLLGGILTRKLVARRYEEEAKVEDTCRDPDNSESDARQTSDSGNLPPGLMELSDTDCDPWKGDSRAKEQVTQFFQGSRLCRALLVIGPRSSGGMALIRYGASTTLHERTFLFDPSFKNTTALRDLAIWINKADEEFIVILPSFELRYADELLLSVIRHIIKGNHKNARLVIRMSEAERQAAVEYFGEFLGSKDFFRVYCTLEVKLARPQLDDIRNILFSRGAKKGNPVAYSAVEEIARLCLYYHYASAVRHAIRIFDQLVHSIEMDNCLRSDQVALIQRNFATEQGLSVEFISSTQDERFDKLSLLYQRILNRNAAIKDIKSEILCRFSRLIDPTTRSQALVLHGGTCAEHVNIALALQECLFGKTDNAILLDGGIIAADTAVLLTLEENPFRVVLVQDFHRLGLAALDAVLLSAQKWPQTVFILATEHDLGKPSYLRDKVGELLKSSTGAYIDKEIFYRCEFICLPPATLSAALHWLEKMTGLPASIDIGNDSGDGLFLHELTVIARTVLNMEYFRLGNVKKRWALTLRSKSEFEIYGVFEDRPVEYRVSVFKSINPRVSATRSAIEKLSRQVGDCIKYSESSVTSREFKLPSITDFLAVRGVVEALGHSVHIGRLPIAKEFTDWLPLFSTTTGNSNARSAFLRQREWLDSTSTLLNLISASQSPTNEICRAQIECIALSEKGERQLPPLLVRQISLKPF